MEKQTNSSTDKLVSINWQPNPASSKAMHKQIVDYISAKVANGDWTVGSKLPPQRELAKIFGVNRSTIINAMETLKSYGIIDADYGGGTRIACNTWSLLMSAPPDWNKYIASGPFKPNLPTIQLINKLRGAYEYEAPDAPYYIYGTGYRQIRRVYHGRRNVFTLSALLASGRGLLSSLHPERQRIHSPAEFHPAALHGNNSFCGLQNSKYT